MNLTVKAVFLLAFCGTSCGTLLAHGQITSFKHVIVVVQENRTPDNLFQGLCTMPFGTAKSCSTKPKGSLYDIQTRNWLDKTSSTGTTNPTTTTLVGTYDLSHAHYAFTTQCDVNASGVCKMDDAAGTPCVSGTCPSRPAFAYVINAKSILSPYLTMATSYGWANYMFQTNQGPSFPAHQFIFGGTSAPSASDDAIATFAAENLSNHDDTVGCIADEGVTVSLITPAGETGSTYPCFEHTTLSDLLEGVDVTWSYYTPNSGTTIWTAPNAIDHICMPSAPFGGVCTGPEWTDHVLSPRHRF